MEVSYKLITVSCISQLKLKVIGVGFIIFDIAEDPKDREDARMRRLRGEEEGVTSAMVVKMIEDSMRVFWDFVHEDKEEVAKGVWFDQNEFVSNSSDHTSKLIYEVRMELNKVG